MRELPPLLPYLVVSDAKAAIAFYKAAFGAVELERHAAPGGASGAEKIMNARLEINGGTFMLADDFPEYKGGKGSTPEALGGSPVTLHLTVGDVDAVWAKAVAAGATVTMPLADQFWGDRYGQVLDPFGHSWSMAQHKVEMTAEQVEEAAKGSFK